MKGGISRLNMKRVCGKDRCAGEQAVLVIDRGKTNQRLNVLFTDAGVFHKIVHVDRGTKSLHLKIEGPKSLSSGPFRTFSWGKRDGGDGCASARDFNGC